MKELILAKREMQKLSLDESLKYFLNLNSSLQSKLILTFSKSRQRLILSHLSDDQIFNICNFLTPDEITDILQVMGKNRQKDLLMMLGLDVKSKVEYLMNFSPKSAIGLMSLDFVSVNVGDDLKYLAKLLKKHKSRTGRNPIVLVQKNDKLLGELYLDKLIFSDKKYVDKDLIKSVPRVNYDIDKDELISVFKRNPHNKVVVLDQDVVLGVLYSDDVIDLIEEHESENIFKFAGVVREEEPLDMASTKVKYRYKWLILNLLTAFLAASVVAIFESTIDRIVVLAMYMPVIAGMGGNAAMQSMAVTLRGLALREIDEKNARYLIMKEIYAGLMNGVIIGVMVSIVAILFNQNAFLGLVLFMAMVINLFIAGLFGSIVPVVLKKLGHDPAIASSIFITTATDVFGFFALLGLAAILL